MPSELHKKVVWPGSTQLAPVPTVLVGCGGSPDVRPNLITVAWTGVVCSRPPMISIALRPERYSYTLIRRSGEFTVNLPGADLAETVDWCGVVSGRDHDKFAERGLTAVAGTRVTAPVVGECPLALECRVSQVLELGTHHLFLADILAVQAAEVLLDAEGRLDLERFGMLAYVHGHYYELGRCIGHFGYSVRRKPGKRGRR